MAAVAIECDVSAFEGKLCGFMIECRDESRGFRVAAGAIGAESRGGMRRFRGFTVILEVAGRAGGVEPFPLFLSGNNMAFDACDRPVGAAKGKPGRIVKAGEILHSGEGRGLVASGAVDPELSIVDVFVAFGAGARGSLEMKILMALRTGERAVLSDEGEPGAVVTEGNILAGSAAFGIVAYIAILGNDSVRRIIRVAFCARPRSSLEMEVLMALFAGEGAVLSDEGKSGLVVRERGILAGSAAFGIVTYIAIEGDGSMRRIIRRSSRRRKEPENRDEANREAYENQRSI
jgi:hypothetical protein